MGSLVLGVGHAAEKQWLKWVRVWKSLKDDNDKGLWFVTLKYGVILRWFP